MKRKKSKSSPVKAKLLTAFLHFLAVLPFSITRFLGRVLGALIWYSNAREKVVSVKNIELCFPELSKRKQLKLARLSCIHSGMVFTESAWIWLNSAEKVNCLFKNVEGSELLEAALEKENGVILTGPHLGNWEAFLAWAGKDYPSSGMYRIPKILELDSLIRQSREKSGVELIVADHKSVRQMLRALKKGKLLLILSDQNPVANSGVYSPFFGVPAYTMTLIPKLIEKTDAELLFFHAERVAGGFSINIKAANFDRYQPTIEDFTVSLNKALEQQIRLCPEQFEWGYKRFRPQPDGKIFY